MHTCLHTTHIYHIYYKCREHVSSWQLFSECKVKKVFPVKRMNSFFIEHFFQSTLTLKVSSKELQNYAQWGVHTKMRGGDTDAVARSELPACWKGVRESIAKEDDLVASMLSYHSLEVFDKNFKNFSNFAT